MSRLGSASEQRHRPAAFGGTVSSAALKLLLRTLALSLHDDRD
ncbi:MAG: hypothetical protein R2844_16985 [Caldilineales bacterium]